MIIIGRIEYLNLLPFHFFLKRYNYKFIEKNGYPAQINKLFLKRKVEAGFISSIKSKNQKCLNAGIVANKKVMSVLICPGENKEDKESNTSNILAKVLNEKGEVVIGDKALQRFYKNNNCKDMAALWYKKYKLPFVFALFCINSNNKEFKKIINKFLKKRIKVPQYILKSEAKRLGLSPKHIQEYLNQIYYKIGYKEKKALKLFLKLSQKVSNE